MSQAIDILNYIDQNGSITDNEARDLFCCHRLSARIHDLRLLGVNIVTDRLTGKNRYGTYSYARYRRG